MTPKDKAIELVDKFKTFGAAEYVAKDCALICVDEIAESCAWLDHKIKRESLETFRVPDKYFAYYWEEVKQEIEKL